MQSSASSAAGPSHIAHPPPTSTSSSSLGKPDRLFVGNFAPTVDEYTLIQVFQKYGKITKLDYMFHKSGPLKGKPRGYAFIEFSNKDVRIMLTFR
jgi:RNA recognition motif-containing protein